MYIYKPNSVVLPESLKLTRIFPKVSGSESAYRNELDSNTIFYDVFLDRNTRRLRGIGPRLLNLKSQILPLHVLVNGEKVSLRIHQVKNLFFFETERLSNLLHDSINVTLHFKNFKNNIKLNWKRDECELEKFDENLLTISALQKDNHFTWIRDWILWHRRLHKVGRVVLYDNGSVGTENSNRATKISRTGSAIDFCQLAVPIWDPTIQICSEWIVKSLQTEIRNSRSILHKFGCR